MANIAMNDFEAIKELKVLEKKERELILAALSSNEHGNSADELLMCLSSVNLLSISSEYHTVTESSIGYQLAVSAANTLGRLYQSMIPVKVFLIKEIDKATDHSQNKGVSDELKKTTLIVNDILNEITQLLLCDGFLHAIDISVEGDEGNMFVKKLNLKRYSRAIPNPHSIPTVYRDILSADQKEIYRVYANFTNYFTCNWSIAMKRLGKIKKSFNELHNLCPFIRLSITQSILHDMNYDSLPSDIIKSIAAIDPKNLIYFHASYIESLIHNLKNKPGILDGLTIELKKIAEMLTHPLKDIIQFNIVMEATIKLMMMMRELQAQNSLPNQHVNNLRMLEKFVDEIQKRKHVSINDMLAMSHKIAKPFMIAQSDKSVCFGM